MIDDKPFDRRLRRLRRDRAAPLLHGADYLHRRVCDELIERLELVRRPFAEALNLGCADASLSNALRARGIRVADADAGFRFALAAGGVQCDEDRLPFADSSFDLIVSAAALDTVNDLPGALLLIRRALRPDGLFLAALSGAGSLPRLRQAMLDADELSGSAAARIHPQIDVRAAGDLLGRAGFALPVADVDTIDVRFGSLPSLIRDLRAMAATNILASQRRALGGAQFAEAAASFASAAAADGKVAERFEILYLSGWAPAPDQPQPARRGSATVSLAAALRPPSA